MKKTLIFVLAALMLLSFTACGGSAGNDNGTEPASVSEAQSTPADTAEATQTTDAAPVTEAPQSALLPGELYQLGDAEAPVLRGLSLAGNRSGSAEFNAKAPGTADIRCIFELDEWVEVTPDTDAKDGLAVWIFKHRANPEEYKDLSVSEETPGFAATLDLPYDPDAEASASRGSFYLNPEEAEAGYYDLVFTLDGKPAALLLTRFYNDGELAEKTDEELMQLIGGLQ